MMFHALGNLGQAVASGTATSLNITEGGASSLNTPQGSVDCSWCKANPATAMFMPSCWATKSMFGGSCQAYSTPQAYLIGAGSAMPPDQSAIDAQDPTDTINQILAAQQAGAVDAATAADVTGATNSATNPFGLPDIPGLPSGSTMWMIIAALAVVGATMLKK